MVKNLSPTFSYIKIRESIHKKACANPPAHQFTAPEKLPETSFLNTSTISSSDSAKKRCLDDFEMLNPGNNRFGSDLGKGAFGQVKLVREKANPNNLYALKIVCYFSHYHFLTV